MRTLRPGLSGDDPLATIRLPQKSLCAKCSGVANLLNTPLPTCVTTPNWVILRQKV